MAASRARSQDPGLVFVGGFPSGGTDLLQSILNAHSQVFIPGEFPFLSEVAARFGASVPAAEVDALIDALKKADGYDHFFQDHWHNFTTNRRDPVELEPMPEPVNGGYEVATIYNWLLGVPEHIRWCGNKTPSNTENIDRLNRLFPKARFIVIVRDVRDVVCSWEAKWGRDAVLTADKYQRRMLLGLDHLGALDSTAWCVVHFERLLDNFEDECRRMCDLLELEFEPSMFRFHEHVTKFLDGKPNWGRPLVPGNYGKWRTTLPHRRLVRVEEVAFPAMRALNYAPEVARRPRPLTRWEWARGRARDVYSTVVVGNRYQRNGRIVNQLKTIALNVRKVTRHRVVMR
jgi:Sulfotransferase family